MQVLPINTVPVPSTASSSSVGTASSSSRDIASSTLTPSVTVSISNSNKAESIANIAVPPVYTRVSVGASTTNQLSPSRNPAERSVPNENSEQPVSDADVAERPIVSDQAISQENDETEQQSSESDDDAQASIVGQTEAQNQSPGRLTEEQLEVVQALEIRDREVRAHEQAHKSVGGALAGAVSYSYQSGPNGQRYAVGGEVSIDASPVQGDPAATIRKMNTVRAAATAPVDPSAQDLSVAAAASRVLAQARKDLATENIASQNALASQGSSREEDGIKSISDEESTTNNTEIRTNLKTEYEEVIAPLESKSVRIDRLI